MNTYAKHDDVWEKYSDTIESHHFHESPIMFQKEESYKKSSYEVGTKK